MPINFSNPINLNIPAREGFIHELAAGDFNADGITDVVAARFLFPLENRALDVQVLFGDGVGGFSEAPASFFVGGTPRTVHPREIVVADFNGDGRSDIFIADHGYDAPPFPGFQNTLLLSTAGGRLQNVTSTHIPQLSDFTHSAAAGDIDGDGDTDLLVGTIPSPYFFINDGSGNFAVNASFTPAAFRQNPPLRINTELLADFNNDGLVDLFVGKDQVTTHQSMIYLNPGNGDFSSVVGNAIPTPALKPAPNFDGGPATPAAYDSQVIDLNRDAFSDLVVVWTNGNATARYIQLLTNNGNGSFTDVTSTLLPQDLNNADPWLKYVHLFDFDGDGRTDILTEAVNVAPRVYLNTGSGFAFGGEIQFAEGALEPLDADRDGDMEVIVWNGAGFSLRENLINLFSALTSANADAARGLAAAYDTLLGGVPTEAGFKALLSSALSTNFGAGPGPVFNAENIFINLTNNLVQGNSGARAAFDAIATGTTLAEKIASIYEAVIPPSAQTAEGLAFITRPDGIDFYQSVAAERGVAGTDGAAIVAMASLLQIAAAQNIGIGNAVNDLIRAIAAGSDMVPASGGTFTDVEFADGSQFDGDDGAVSSAAVATLFQARSTDDETVELLGIADPLYL